MHKREMLRAMDIKGGIFFHERPWYKVACFDISETSDGHYQIFLKTCITTKHQYGDFGQPSKDLKQLGECTSCPMHSFKPKTEKARHIKVVHRRRKNKVDKPKNHTCSVCEAAFSSLSSLNHHKKPEKHTACAVKRNLTENSQCPTKKPRKTRQRTLQDYLRQHEKATTSTNQETNDDDDDDSLKKECEGNECLINDEKLDGDIINCTWLECIKCSSWFHAYCVNIDLKMLITYALNVQFDHAFYMNIYIHIKIYICI